MLPSAIKLRSTSGTALNSESSRSHAIISVRMTAQKNDFRFNVIDLPGHESNKDKEGPEKQISTNIRQSLLNIRDISEALKSGKGVAPWLWNKGKLHKSNPAICGKLHKFDAVHYGNVVEMVTLTIDMAGVCQGIKIPTTPILGRQKAQCLNCVIYLFKILE